MHYLKSGVRFIQLLFHQVKNERRYKREVSILEKSGLIDSTWYLDQHRDVAAAGIPAAVHYYHWGAWEGRNPNPDFDSDWYISQNPDVVRAGMNPLLHYFLYGKVEGRLPRLPDSIFDLKQIQAAIQLKKTTRSRKSKKSLVNPDGPKVLIIDSIYPRPDRDSGSNDTLNFIKLFIEFGFQVNYLSDSENREHPESQKHLERMGINCIALPEYPSLEDYIYREGPFVELCFLCRMPTGGRHYETLRRYCPNARIILNTVDLHFLREEREALLNHDTISYTKSQETKEREFYLIRQVDLTIVVSKYEEVLIRKELPWVNVVYLPLIRDCPGRINAYKQREGIAFIGGFTHKPNIDAVDYFLEGIWPLIHRKDPSINFYLIGSDLPEKYKELNDPNIHPIGYVEDLDPWLERIRLTVAPLRYGAGAKGKIVTSLTYGVPCVASVIASEGVGLTDGVNISIAGNPTQFAQWVISLYSDKKKWTYVSNQGYKFAISVFSFKAGRKRLSAILVGLGFSVPMNNTREQQSKTKIPRQYSKAVTK